jgi:hypothetical protein
LVLRKKLVFGSGKIVILLIIPLFWNILVSFNNSFYSLSQGVFYLSTPVIMLFIGFQFSKLFTFKDLMKAIIYIGTFIALIYIISSVYKSGLNAFYSPYIYSRGIVGPGSPAVVLALILCLYLRKYEIFLFRISLVRYLFILINITAIYLFASRSYLIILFIFLIIFQIQLINKYKYLLICVAGSLFLLLFFYNFSFKNSQTKNSNNLNYKLINTLTEIKIRNYKTYKEINTNYRSYESYRAIQTYKDGTPVNLIFGHGNEKSVDLKMKIFLQGFKQLIPWIHNGYFFVLIREGALGLLFVLLFFIWVFKTGIKNFNTNNKEQRLKSLLLLGCGLSLLVANYVVCAFYTFEMSILMVTIGTLLQLLSKKKNHDINSEILTNGI